MSPKRIVRRAVEKGLDMIVLSDHNSVENVGAAIIAGEKKGLAVFPGMEICSSEEVHLLGIFENLEQASQMQTFIYDHLTGSNNPEVFGDQWVINEKDEYICDNNRLLIGATQLDVNAIAEKIHELSGLCIASHVDRPAYGIISQLGFIPPDLALDGLEISRHMSVQNARETLPDIRGYPCVTSSDAHFLDDIGKVYTCFKLNAPIFGEIRLAINGEGGRRIVYE
jgi:predicted metal-dependent phosphoesterase TrpH